MVHWGLVRAATSAGEIVCAVLFFYYYFWPATVVCEVAGKQLRYTQPRDSPTLTVPPPVVGRNDPLTSILIFLYGCGRVS